MANEFDDPFAPADGTVLRPRPGGSRRTMSDARPEPSRPARSAESAGPTLSIADFLAGRDNPVLQAASPLIAIASRLQSSVIQADALSLRAQAVEEVRAFDDRLRAAHVSTDDALVARYLLCTFFDSAVLNTPWGSQSDWSGHSLLITFHKEKSGGEKFFQILERLSAQPQRYIDLIELQYVCLALGYEGRYRLDEQGRGRLAELEHKLFRTIREVRGLRDAELSVHWRGVEDRRNPVFRYAPWWIIAAAGLAILVVAFVVYSVKLNAAAAPIKQQLSAAPAAAVEYAAPVVRINRLKELLAPQGQAGQLTVEDFGEMTVVTLIANDLFRSGSAQVNPAHENTLRAVAAALNDVPGKVLVVGHTDDQPVRSLRFADNFELSRERAVSVANVLKPVITNFGRVEWVGLGATQPRYQPVDTAENRARNRRVEIVSANEGVAP
jgi:type VI secretion system protein ImpK